MSLAVFWFCVVAFFWAGYFVLEGFDFGVGMLLPFLPRNEGERGELFRTIGPVWDGNEVWLVVAGAATFAAFPAWYGTMFSGFYLALLLILLFLMLRVVSFEWRGKADSLRWRRGWLCANAIGSVGAPLIWGIALANLLHGVPLDSNGDFNGSFTDLFSFYTVLVGIATVALFAFHGAAFLTLKTSGDLEQRARSAAQRLSVPAAGLVVLALGFTVAVAVDRNHKSITAPLVVAIVAGLALLVAVGAVVKRRTGIAFALTAVSTLLFVATIFTSLYPRVLVSAPNFANSLTVTNSASAHYTLAVMSVVALTITPIVLLYQAWTYIVFRDRVTTQP